MAKLQATMSSIYLKIIQDSSHKSNDKRKVARYTIKKVKLRYVLVVH